MKKLISFILAVIMIISVVPFAVTAFAGNYYYNSNKVKFNYVESGGKTFDSYGRVIKEKDGDYTTTYTYDSHWNITKVTSKSGSSTSTTVYKYNSDNYLTEKKDTYNGETRQHFKYEYDSKGRMIKETSTYGDDPFFETVIYTKYDAKGNPVEKEEGRIYYDDKIFTRESLTKITNAYNKSGKLTKQNSKTTYPGDDDEYIIETVTNTYNSSGSLIKVVVSTKEKNWMYTSTVTTTTTYRSDGKELVWEEKEHRSDRKKDSIIMWKYFYDSKGRVSKIEWTCDGTEMIFYYTYNSKGKLIKELRKRKVGNAYYNDSLDEYTYNSNNCIATARNVIYSYGSDTTDRFVYAKAKHSVYLINEEDAVHYKDTYVYTGKPIKPCLYEDFSGINYNGKFRGPDFDYTVTNNVNIGIGKIKIDGVTLTFKIVPAQVKNVKVVKAKNNSLDLTWDSVKGAQYYKVEQSADGKTWKTVKSACTKTTTTVTDLKAGTEYKFRVTALDKSKKYAGKASAVLDTQTTCVSPTVTLTSPKSKTAAVSWNKVKGAKSYTVYKSTDGSNWTKVKTVTGTSCTFSNLTGGKKIYVKVCSTNKYGANSVYSAIKSVTVRR